MWTIYKTYTKNSRFFKKLSYLYNNDLDKACFQYDMTYNKFKDFKKNNTIRYSFKK